jgi:DUF4097 and DUF4098 domain-containing protein YvlB
MHKCLIFLFFLFAQSLPSQELPNTAAKAPDDSYTEREEKQFQFYPGGKMQIASEVPGFIRIIGWKKGTVQVQALKTVSGLSPEAARQEIEKHPLRVQWNQTSARIKVEGTPAETVSMDCDLTIYVPGDKTDINASIIQGDIYVEKVNGWVELTSGRGNLGMFSMSGYFSGSTGKGNIRVDMSGKRWRGLEFGAITREGSIDLQLPEEYSAALKLETLDGKVLVDYPPRIVDGEPVPLAVGIRKKAQALDALVGTGGAPIKLVSHAGDIRLSLKE